ncbi:hypothetical protein [Methanohalophilus sp. WG1-DM]|uniref:hypothetical protein n=1 Tax=Methanohalophilus sp. WG1-DM TaxID=2491675 RepID=UPI0010279DF5|nr:hypothetical protein [Methanohalophilus sp. WG1-DM]RXG35173.1 DNA-directed DNA polymerase B [Methanohalophilus sp. WG1-DM]
MLNHIDAPFAKDYQKIVYKPFIDYQTGEIRQGSYYFKPLSNTILEYVDHPEHKFVGEIGILARKHTDIDDQELDVARPQKFINKQEIMDNILNMSQKQAEDLGVSRCRFQGIKNRIREDGDLNLNIPAVRRLIN